MFKYIFLPKLVAFYLREFSTNKDYQASTLYQFVFVLCLPFVSITFRKARLAALAIAECTQSSAQISRLLEKLTGVEAVTIYDPTLDRYCDLAFGGDSDDADNYGFPYSGADEDNPIVPYSYPYNTVNIEVLMYEENQRYAVEAYAKLLIPFYVKYTIDYVIIN